MAVLVLPLSAWQTHQRLLRRWPDIASGKVTLVRPSHPGQNKTLLTGSAPKCCSPVLSRVFVTHQLMDFENFRSGETFEGSFVALLCQMCTWFKGLIYAPVSPGCFAPRDGK